MVVRAYMQSGAYRRALAFVAHTAGAHGENRAATALYAWLLHAGGQQEVARRLLDTALAVATNDPTLHGVAEQLASSWPVAAGELLVPPLRFAPYALGAAATGSVVTSATLIDAGRRALAPGSLVPSGAGREMWVRNALGNTVAATVERRLDVAGLELVVLELAAPLPMPEDLVAAARPPFAGSVGYAVEFASTMDTEPAWPLLRLGFFGRSTAAVELPLLGIDLPGGSGGPAFDDAGRFAGVALPAVDASQRLATVAALPEDVRSLLGELSSGSPTPRSAMDITYERALLMTLQVIVANAPL